MPAAPPVGGLGRATLIGAACQQHALSAMERSVRSMQRHQQCKDLHSSRIYSSKSLGTCVIGHRDDS